MSGSHPRRPISTLTTRTVQDAYLKNLATGDLKLVSQADNGTKGNGNSYYPFPVNGGESVVFNTQSSNLALTDSDTYEDVYVKGFTSVANPDADGDGSPAILAPAKIASNVDRSATFLKRHLPSSPFRTQGMEESRWWISSVRRPMPGCSSMA